MQHANQTCEAQEPRIRLQKHAFDFVHFCNTCAALLFRGLLEPMGHGGK